MGNQKHIDWYHSLFAKKKTQITVIDRCKDTECNKTTQTQTRVTLYIDFNSLVSLYFSF